MKICFIAKGDPYNNKLWSGTPYNVITKFEQYDNIEISTFNIKSIIKHPIYDIIRKTVGKIFYLKGSTRDPIVFKRDSKKIQKALNAINADVNFFCAEYCLAEHKENTLYYAYVDTTERPLLEADNKKKLGIQIFLKYYEKNEISCYNLLDGIFTMNAWSKESANKLYKKDRFKVIQCWLWNKCKLL